MRNLALGIDPGGREVGLCLIGEANKIATTVVLAFDVVRRLPSWTEWEWLTNVVHEVKRVRDTGGKAPAGQLGVIPVIEGIVAPRGFTTGREHHFTDPTGIIETAKVYGAIVGAVGPLVLPPAGFGSGPLSAYPECLRPLRGKGAGHDRLRHARSAYDLAIAGRKARWDA